MPPKRSRMPWRIGSRASTVSVRIPTTVGSPRNWANGRIPSPGSTPSTTSYTERATRGRPAARHTPDGFVEDRNIGDIDELVTLAQSVGLPPRQTRRGKCSRTEVLGMRRPCTAVDADWEKSRRYGITGVPTFVAGGHDVVGAQPYEAAGAVSEHRGGRRSVRCHYMMRELR